MDYYAEGSREVPLVRGHDQQMCALTWAFRRDGDYELTIQAPDGAVRAVGRDLFYVLQLLRRQLEPSGWQVAVQGGRRTAWASGMQRNMTGGRRVYICELGREVKPREAVDLFAPAQDGDIDTVDAQLAFHEEWKASRHWPA
ncbi:hypothetical protein GCM10022251_74000 [Phytohabitans flavus]|uniref:Uncharacterized protein n=1 Tax=Phytohabitans flavus TaxID=1076124 RepID=A0A6F8XKY5_9ACTN|nr:hypothetical protein [Phytohabitans flavus]BCB74477.1 hypothetical protein Pflav_008870 [Phytohabitans flavus]